MSARNTSEYDRELEGARERELDSLLEQEFAGEPPIAAILQRAEVGAIGSSRKPVRSWLAAALVLLGIGVAVALAWDARSERDDDNSATPQDPAPVDLQWPKDVPRIHSFDKMSTVPGDATHLILAMSVDAARDFSRLANLQHLAVRPTVIGMVKLIKSGGGEEGSRLDALATAKGLRRLSIQGVPLGPGDLAALRHLPQLKVLEFSTLLEINDELMAQAQKGGSVIGRPLDRAMGTAIARSSRAKTLWLSGMSLTVDGLRALADAELHSLILDGPPGLTPDVLEVLGELKTLRRLELRSIHSSSLAKEDGGSIAANGLRALTPEVMRRIGELPVLQSLTLDVCYLDAKVVAALPRQLQHVDLSSCFGVGGSLVDVVAAMPELREVGLPMVMASGKDFMSMWRPPLRGTTIHTRRLSSEEAAAIIGSRVWQALCLDGQLAKPVADELANQSALHSLALRPTSGSESLAFVAQMPKLEKISFHQVTLTEQMVQPLNDCSSLRSVAFDSCQIHRQQETGRLGLRRDIALRWGYRVAR